MTRKDYILLADALMSARNECRSAEAMLGTVYAACYIADKLASDNPRFDRERFLKAASAI